MATAQLGTVLRHIHKLAAGPRLAHWTDRQLLDDFATRHDETAFTTLMARHGPMVLRVRRRMLHHEQDAEDAFQATFLVLAKNLASIRKRDALAGWLHGVAFRTAMKARRSAARRRNHEAHLWRTGCVSCRVEADPAANAAGSPTWHEVQAVLDEELQSLSDHHRAAFVLCVLEGKSVPEAAAELGCKPGTASSWLTRARQRLRVRLECRGIQLAALLAALSVAESAAQAGVPAALGPGTLRFGLLVAAGEPAASVIPTHIVALAAGVTRAMFLTKVKIAVVILFAIGLVTGGGALAHQALAGANENPELQAKASAKPHAEDGTAAKGDTIEFRGRVIDPDGQPVHRAKLLFIYASADKVPEKVWATSAADGRFHFSVAKSIENAPYSGNVWDYSYVMAAAEGYGFAFARVKPDATGDVTLQLAKDDLPIQGRILDLQGKPIAGVAVRIDNQVEVPQAGDLTKWLETFKANKQGAGTAHSASLLTLHSPTLGTLFPPVQTGADGRFVLKGIGRERVASLRIEGPTIATQVVKAMTRAGEKVPQAPHGAPFELLAVPTKPVEGVVRDKDTGKPLAGVAVRSYIAGGADDFNKLARTTTDKDGRYRLVGLPKGDGNAIIAEAYDRTPQPSDLPYLAAIRKVGNTAGLEPVTLDIPLKRGVWIKGRVIDKATGKTVMGGFDYFCFADNPSGRELPLLNGLPSDFTRKDGSYRTVALPGRGLIAMRASTDRYRMAVGAEKIKEKLDKGPLLNTLPYHLYPGNVHTIAEVSPKEGDESITCDVFLDPGHTLQGTVLGADGKPLAGARVAGLRPMGYWENEPLKNADFTMWGLGSDEKRTLQMIHEEKKLAGWREVRADEKGPVRIQLEPWGTLTGRLATPDGEPMTGVAIQAGSHGGQPDKDGKFRIDGFAPGLKCSLRIIKDSLYSLEILSKNAKDIAVKAGETKDLGDIQVKPMQ